MERRALVIGGSGFIGMHTLRTLKRDGRYAKVVSLDIAEPTERIDGFDYVIHDCRQQIPTDLADVDTDIYNLPALRTFPGHPDEEYFETNYGTTERIIALAEATGVRTIIFTSTMSVYATGDEPKTEESAIDPCNAYGASKVKGEALHRQWLTGAMDRRLVICRPAVIFGYRDNGNFTRLANALRSGYFVFVGRSETIKSAGYVTDLADSFLFALDKMTQSGAREVLYNFAYPERLTIRRIADAFCTVGGYPRVRMVLPPWLLNTAALLFEALNAIGVKNPIHRKRLTKLYESTNIVPKWLEDEKFPFRTDIVSALAEWKSESPSGRFI
ncbi:NAD-dependent epimerase/dehydratase family protein [Novosphingobium sp. Chol11]|uniref:NAD-dependent epimerase/dehydratase family protein n=1 Tax=Novosphingobium sp. Chol11 TaxID=1385763 RepID=UPI0025F707D5|nr:NAD-dependent epimerase/dehydratase family protein [Novosphingobium sp. Chol11]